MNTSTLGTLNFQDFEHAAMVAIGIGILLPALEALQQYINTPGFNVSTLNWHTVFLVAINGAVSGFLIYLVKALSTDSTGKVFGKI